MKIQFENFETYEALGKFTSDQMVLDLLAKGKNDGMPHRMSWSNAGARWEADYCFEAEVLKILKFKVTQK